MTLRNELKIITMVFLIVTAFFTQAQMTAFTDGPQIKGYGKNAAVSQQVFDKDAKFKVAFDIFDAAEEGTVNRKIDSLARFINMHVAAGVKPENIELALVVHGRASLDLLDNETYQNQLIKGAQMSLSAMTAHALLQQDGYTTNPF